MKSSRQTGLSLVESLVVLVISGLLLAIAMPRLDGAVQRHRLDGAGESFRSDFQLARMQALGSGRTVRISFASDVGGSCYVVHHGEAGSCSCSSDGRAQCLSPQQLLSHQSLPQSRGLRIAANVRNMAIDGQLGTVTPTATVRLTNSHGDAMSHIVAITGRVRSCGGPQSRCQA